MMTGQKVVCVNARFPVEVLNHYTALPVLGGVYTVRSVCVGVNWAGEPGEVCVHLEELRNPRSSKPPHPERGFNAERFRPLEEVTEAEPLGKPETVSNQQGE